MKQARVAGAWLGHKLWQLASLPEALRFQRDLYRIESVQRRLLSALLTRQAPSAYGLRYGLAAIPDYQAFREQVPVSSYEDLQPYLPSGLNPDRVPLWEPTGGSSAGSKWIPWTRPLQAEFRRAVAVWVFHLLRQYPELVGGRAYWQLTPKSAIEAPSWLAGYRTGFERDSDYLGPLGRLLESLVLVSPTRGFDHWGSTVTALLGASDLRLLSCWSPSFLLCLQAHIERRTQSWQPRRWWPRLRLISCWTGAASAAYLPRLRELFPGVEIQPKGLLSTEAVTTIPLGHHTPLAYRGHFFEFAEGERVFPAWELRQGQEARVIVTTGGGLTRYDTGDRVRVTGHLGQVPCLEFLGREGTVDQVGEKLSMLMLEQAARQVPGFAMFGFEKGGYVLFLQDTPEAALWLARTETFLQRSFTYRDAQALGQLRPLRAFRVTGDAFAEYALICHQRLAQREGTAKALPFHPWSEWSAHFTGDFLDSSGNPEDAAKL